jgi:surface protein
MSEMFYDCSSLTELDVSGFDTSNVTNMSEMFAGCRSITTLDLFNWSSASLSANGATSMFAYCTSLQTIYTSESFDLSTKKSSADVFTNCYYLVGGLGTSYNSSHVNYAYGHLDSVSNPGYFTYYLPITGIAATVAENVEINDDTELTPEDFNVSMVYEGGVSTSIPVGVASYAQVGDLATATSPNWPNKYSNNLTEANTAQEFTFDGAQYITVEFDSTSKLESASCDWVSVYDADGTNYGGKGVLGGTAIAGTTLTIPGNYVKIAMRSDSSSTYKGYSATITAYGTAGYSSYNYTVERSSDADGNLIAIITLDPDCCGTAYQTTVALS